MATTAAAKPADTPKSNDGPKVHTTGTNDEGKFVVAIQDAELYGYSGFAPGDHKAQTLPEVIADAAPEAKQAPKPTTKS